MHRSPLWRRLRYPVMRNASAEGYGATLCYSVDCDEKTLPQVFAAILGTVRSKRRPQLHPAMRERMWKPGQSGNLSGVSKAYAEAMREMASQPVELSAGAERARRWRSRKQNGLVIVSLDVSADLTALLPPGMEVSGLGPREYAFQQPGLTRKVWISTNPAYYEQNTDNVELRSLGNLTFLSLATGPENVQADTLADILQRSRKDQPAG